MEKSKGKLIRWIDNKGFGFIKPENRKDDVFIHISAFKGMSRKPVVGDVIYFEIGKDAKGKFRAVNASIEGEDQVLSLEPIKHKRSKEYSAPINKRRYKKSIPVKNPSSSKKLIPVLIVIAIGVNVFQSDKFDFTLTNQVQGIDKRSSLQLSQAFKNQQSDIQLGGVGTVIRMLSDDTDGSQHQRFILKLSSGQTLLVAHNIDLASRINMLREGDRVEFYGEYEWNSKGGVIHWTHHDPRGNHEDGWLKHNGSIYQ